MTAYRTGALRRFGLTAASASSALTHSDAMRTVLSPRRCFIVVSHTSSPHCSSARRAFAVFSPPISSSAERSSSFALSTARSSVSSVESGAAEESASSALTASFSRQTSRLLSHTPTGSSVLSAS